MVKIGSETWVGLDILTVLEFVFCKTFNHFD